MVLIPGGTFRMGSPDGKGFPDEHPQQEVALQPFYLDRYEVTEELYARFDPNHTFPNGHELFPATRVSWEDASRYAEWAGKRLPTEAEWEYACRAGGRHSYCGGNNLGQLGWYGGNGGNSGNRQQPVARKQPNAFGLYDMSGNVWEWVQDCWHDSYAGAPSNGSAWTTGECSVRVRRGGSRNDDATSARAAERRIHSPGDRYNLIGLRLARTR